MKATIAKPDGTKIEAEGTAEELLKLAGVTTGGAPHICAPCLLPHFPPVPFAPLLPIPIYPFGVNPQPGFPYGTNNVCATC